MTPGHFQYQCSTDPSHEVTSPYALADACPVYVFGNACGGGLSPCNAPAQKARKPVPAQAGA